jgi:pimeloyl-ACP methyl ester carboxylesterase
VAAGQGPSDDDAVRRGGRETGPVLLLLHGLGATGAVWDPVARLADERWPGPWLAPDLAGHGRAAPGRPYAFGRYAAEVARLLDPDDEVVVVGHSMGGVVALMLASGWFRLGVRAAIGIGIKLRWSADELTKAAALATRPPRTFESREDAVARYLRVSGLDGLATADSSMARDGVVEVADGWQLAQDPATFAVGAPDVPRILAAAHSPTVVTSGEHDIMCTPEDLHAVCPDAEVLAGLGHNAHVEAPGRVLDLVTTSAG